MVAPFINHVPCCYITHHPLLFRDMQMLPLRTATSTTGGARMDKDQGKREMEEQLEMVTKAFVDHYYNLFDTNRAALACLYDQTSMLSFEGQKILGADEIGRKLSQLPFEQCNHSISTVDCQPSPFVGGILVFVTGNLQLAGEEHQLRFSQMFQLIPTQQASFFVQNDIFRLNYC